MEVGFCKFSMKEGSMAVLLNVGLNLKCKTGDLNVLKTSKLAVTFEKQPRRTNLIMNFADLKMDYSETVLK